MSIAKQAKQILQQADSLILLAGAGMGVDSGLPDFRGKEGFWRAYPPFAKLGLRFEELANPRWFYEDPYLAWGFYGHRFNLYKKTKPHDGFTLLLQTAQKKPKGYFVFTSNVDGQFQKAGFSENAIYEVHGSLMHLQCMKHCGVGIYRAENISITMDEKTMRATTLPQCKNCGSLVRPNILMFGDFSWDSTRSDKQYIQYKKFLASVQKPAIVEIGAGKAVPTVRMQSESLAHRFGVPLIRINPREAEGPIGTLSFYEGALEALRKILSD
ncbi:MAG: NAD-dependent deacetylase [Candidatus Hydrogenedentota bacterium]|nr:MAG: NAD-dependent deacetylase [Candidatus Hydrogenedentota bacterium]